MKTEPSRQIFEKYLNIKFHELRLVAAELFHAHGRTDGPEEANSRFIQFCDRVYNVWSAHYK